MAEALSKAWHPWHVAINGHVKANGYKETRWMYDAKDMSSEVPRLTQWFEKERTGNMPRLHKQCSHSPLRAIPKNHLFCCLGVVCQECEALKAIDEIDSEKMPDELKDEAKAWTCCAHIVSQGGDTSNEGFILHVGDRMYWDNVYESLSSTEEPEQ